MKSGSPIRRLVSAALAVVLITFGTPDVSSGGEEKQPTDGEISALVKRLGAGRFADREAAEKRLRELGVKALPAIKNGMVDPDIEVARRSAAVRAAIARDRLWAAFVKVAGEGEPARELFGEIMNSPRATAAVEAALDDPTRVNALYRDRTAELMRIAAGHPPVATNGKPDVPTVPDVWAAPTPPLGDVAGWLLLGSLQTGDAPWTRFTNEGWRSKLDFQFPFLPEEDGTSSEPIAKAYTGPCGGPLKKLTAAWALRRRENDGLRAALSLAIRYDIPEVVASAREVLKLPASADIGVENRAAALVLVGLHGGKEDLPLLARHTTDARVFVSVIDSSVKVKYNFEHPVVTDGRDLVCQVRDVAAAAMCRVAGRDPAEFGIPRFPKVKHPSGQPMSPKSFVVAGFKSKAAREAAFTKASDWIKSFETSSDASSSRIPTPKP